MGALDLLETMYFVYTSVRGKMSDQIGGPFQGVAGEPDVACAAIVDVGIASVRLRHGERALLPLEELDAVVYEDGAVLRKAARILHAFSRL